MSTPADWVRDYAREADADFRAWELYEKYPEAVAADCHKLMFLQMACEKLCKAYLIQNNTPPEALQRRSIASVDAITASKLSSSATFSRNLNLSVTTHMSASTGVA